jgi:glycogen(starch) synthase
MRLLIWASSYGQTIGGGPVLFPLLAAALAGRGHAVTVLTDRRPERLPAQETRDGVAIHRPPFRRALAGDATLIMAIRREVEALKRAIRPDLVFIPSSSYGEFFHHATTHVCPAPLVVGVQDCFPAEAFGAERMVGRTLRAAGWITACSQAVLDRTCVHLPFARPIASVIHNVVPMPPATFATTPGSAGGIVFLGRLVHQKGVDVLVAAMALLAARGRAPTLTIAGEGEERGALETAIARRGLGDRVRLIGPIAHGRAHDVLARADVVAMPSRIEPFGIVALEAAQAGRPVVASAVDGLPEVVAHGVTGLLVPPDDPAALAQAIAALLDDKARAAAMGLAARRRAADLFDWGRYVNAHEALFERLAGG